VSILPILASLVPPVVLADFTLVSFDERGTGSSKRLLCGPSVAKASSAVAGTVAATRIFAQLEHSCRSAYPALFPTVNTTTSARDMNQLRVALGARRINYYGVSYGTVLGSVYRQLFPSHVRSMVLDGAVDANLSLTTDATLEAPAIQAAIQYELGRCTASPDCPLGAHPVTFYEDLEQRLARSPLPAPGGGDTTPVTEGDLTTATLLYLSAPGFTPGYFPALASAAAGDGAPLRTVGVTLETDLDGKSLVGPLWTVTCNDAVAHLDAKATAALARSLAARYPLGGAEAVANNLIACPGWSRSTEAVAHLHPNKAPTPLVIGNTGDPNTPYASARDLTSAIGGRLVTFVGYGHSWLLNGSTNSCMQTVVGAYFVNAALPARGTRCHT
jgi:pimeloyl-ACP methyl ester carboxylesterase